MTARKLQALLNIHYEIMKAKNGVKSSKQNTGFIDDIPGWQ